MKNSTNQNSINLEKLANVIYLLLGIVIAGLLIYSWAVAFNVHGLDYFTLASIVPIWKKRSHYTTTKNNK